MAWSFVEIVDRVQVRATLWVARITVSLTRDQDWDETLTETIVFKFNQTTRPTNNEVQQRVTVLLQQRNRARRERQEEEIRPVLRRQLYILIRRARNRGVNFDGLDDLLELEIPD